MYYMEVDMEQMQNIKLNKEDAKTGSVKIANDVVAVIAGIATTEIEGVHAMAGNITHELMGKVGMKTLSKGVKVEIQEGVVSVQLDVIIDYGVNIPKVSDKVQNKVKDSIVNMTGFEVKSVNVRIAGLNI